MYTSVQPLLYVLRYLSLLQGQKHLTSEYFGIIDNLGGLIFVDFIGTSYPPVKSLIDPNKKHSLYYCTQKQIHNVSSHRTYRKIDNQRKLAPKIK